jgi:hypothetical protein
VRREAKRRGLDEIAARQRAADAKRKEEAARQQAAVAWNLVGVEVGPQFGFRQKTARLTIDRVQRPAVYFDVIHNGRRLMNPRLPASGPA